jgi:hypothetical protein
LVGGRIRRSRENLDRFVWSERAKRKVLGIVNGEKRASLRSRRENQQRQQQRCQAQADARGAESRRRGLHCDPFLDWMGRTVQLLFPPSMPFSARRFCCRRCEVREYGVFSGALRYFRGGRNGRHGALPITAPRSTLTSWCLSSNTLSRQRAWRSSTARPMRSSRGVDERRPRA